MDHYKQRIEEIVHPLRASEWRKNILRRELWSHFCALMNEQGRTDPAAAQEAFARIGTPETIQNSFYAAISRGERFGYWLDQVTRRHQDESVIRYAVRYSGFSVTTTVLSSAFMVTCVFGLGGKHTAEIWANALVLTLVTAGFWSAWMFPVMMFVPRIESRMRIAALNGRKSREFIRLLAAIGLGGLPVGGIAILVGYLSIGFTKGFSHSHTLEFAYIAAGLVGLVWLNMTMMMPYLFIRAAQHADPIPDWPYAS